MAAAVLFGNESEAERKRITKAVCAFVLFKRIHLCFDATYFKFLFLFLRGKQTEIEAGIDGFMVFDLNFLKPTQMVRRNTIVNGEPNSFSSFSCFFLDVSKLDFRSESTARSSK